MSGRTSASRGPCGQRALDFIDRINDLDGIDAAMGFAAAAVDRHGLETIFISGLPRGNQNLAESALALRHSTDLLGYYCANRVERYCPTLDRVRASNAPFEWCEARDERNEPPRVRALWNVRADFSLHNGFVVPVHGHVAGPAWVSFGSRSRKTIPDKTEIHLMALYLFDRIACLRGVCGRAAGLTSREREVLTWIAAGKTAWEIGEILGIAKRTVDEHSRTAALKLGAVNRVQAIVVALRSGQILP